MKFIFIRHGKTEGNLQGRYIGRTDEPLCSQGIEAIKARQYPPADYVWVSPMKRCRQTAELIYPGKQLVVMDDFRECDFGRFENKNYRELGDDPDYQQWIDSKGTLPFPDGEASEVFKKRCQEAFIRLADQIAAAEKSEQAVVSLVVHGGTIMSIMEAVAVPHKPFYDWQVRNGCGFITEADQAKWQSGIKEAQWLADI